VVGIEDKIRIADVFERDINDRSKWRVRKKVSDPK